MRTDVVIVGGGVIGMSVAMHLARAGCTNVVVLERGTLGCGSSSKGVGGFRQQFDTEINVRMSQISLPTLLAFGDQIDVQQHGYLYLALSAESLKRVEARARQQQHWGVPVELLDHDEVARRWPFLHGDDVHGAAFCAADGYARPPLAVQAYAREAQRMGGQIIEHAEVTGVETSGHGAARRVVAVHAGDRRIATDWLVNAAGPHAAVVAAMAGVTLLVSPLKRQVFSTAPCPSVPRTAPLTIDETTGFHFRPDGEAVLLAMADGEQLGAEDFALDHAFGAEVLRHARHRLPALKQVGLADGRAGLYEMTPDAHPVLGPVPGLQGFVCACGFSGHGFMHSPAAGMLVAEYITTGQATSLDIAPLSIARFAEGRLLGSGHTL
jgi:sarcosine oxidase subunit beta